MAQGMIVNGAYINSHNTRKQLVEFKKLLLKSEGFEKIKFNEIHTIKRKGYRLLNVDTETKNLCYVLITVPVNNISVDRMIGINAQAEKLFKEESNYGLKDRNGLEQILALSNQFTFGREYHPTIINKATYLWYTIATKQLFHNGNKRTAMLTAIQFLSANFVRLNINSAEELYDISVKIAEKKMTENELKNFIFSNSSLDFTAMKKFNELYEIFELVDI
ncbi:type II toxin-antitoxin system death-on-curing family toxin [Leuconostoc pseudomesenteroides]|uniref:type II toxin-antitoxin system death-on-curing family toxin n=1 Tax=Leuconostoc pseudomesenteroides TaxID=33968 RepID=UPI0040366615